MLWESRFWKDDLLRYAKQLARVRASRRPTSDRNYVSVEKAVLLGLFTIRKLVDSNKLSNATEALQLRAMHYPPTGRRVTLLNSERLDQLYDFDHGVRNAVPLRFLCNQAIHSYVFGAYVSRDRKRLVGVHVSSDRHRHKGVWAVPLVEVERAFRTAGTDYPAFATYQFDGTLQDYVVKKYSRKPRDTGAFANRSRM
jgi:hypothetical protein